MVDYGVAVSWMVISPLALLTDILAIVVIAHYFPFFHGTDVTLMSLVCAMAGNVILVLPIPSVLKLREMAWTPSLCTGYVWCFITLRLSQTLSLVVMSVHWSTMLKMSAGRKKYFSTKFLKITTVFIWIISGTIGLLPAIGAANKTFNELNSCQFLAFNLGTGFGLFFIIANISAMFVSVLCAADATFIIKHMKIVAKTKYHAGRFHLPDKQTDLPSHGTSSLVERYHRLNFAWDLSKFVLVFASTSFFVNHFPYAIIQGIQVFTRSDRETLEVIALYLTGLEALLLPHGLWLLSKRYRHALTYMWKLHILRRKDVEEDDPFSCMLQSYTQRERERAAAISSRPASSIGRASGYSVAGTIRSVRSEVVPRPQVHTNGRTHTSIFTSDINAGTIITPVNGVANGEVRVECHAQTYEERPIDIQNLEMKDPSKTVDLDAEQTSSAGIVRRVSEGSSSASQVSNKGSMFPARHDVKRSSSSVSRKEWKDHMRKKHLPPIFINEGFDADDSKVPERNPEEDKETIYKADTGNLSNGSLHFYMSSNYHPDYLMGDTLPKNKIVESETVDNDSEEDSEIYRDADIEEVLEREMQLAFPEHFAGNLSQGTITDKKYSDTFPRPYMSTFKAQLSDEKDNVSHKLSTAKSVYGTYDDLSQSGMLEVGDIALETETVPSDEIDNEFRTWKGLKHTSSTRLEAASKLSNMDKSNKAIERSHSARLPMPDVHNVEVTSTSFSTKSVNGNHDTDSSSETQSHKHINKLSKRERDYRYQSQNPGLPASAGPQLTTSGRDISVNDENDSSSSSCSVTLSPYKLEGRRKPWMDDLDRQSEETMMLHMSDSFVHESDTDTLKESHDSMELPFASNFDYRHSHSELSTPVSSIFDDETERGFEEALEAHVSTASVYGGVGLCFESIKEEPEDLTSSGSNPFLENEEEFRTQAVVSRSSDSRPSSSGSFSDNTFSNSTPQKGNDYTAFGDNDKRTNTPVIVTTDIDFGDSGFTSGLERGNQSDSSDQHEFRRANNLSPWPDNDASVKDTDLSFESDFSDIQTFSSFKPDQFRASGSRKGKETVVFSDINTNRPDQRFSQANDSLKTKLDKHQPDIKKPEHRILAEIKTGTKQSPVRVRSLDEPSPKMERKPPQRGGSFESLKTDVRPVYF